ncbi:MAG: DUF3303 domain-containing protein [Actinobacteria bacterium]|nr:DUF3303 domain-containing protein [Actinomycetota bacterium]
MDYGRSVPSGDALVEGGKEMLFAVVLRAHTGTLNERAARRLQWQYPEGVKPVAEYWLQMDDPSVFAVVETDSMAPLMALRAEWDDLFDIEVSPVVTAEEGLEMLRQMGPS